MSMNSGAHVWHLCCPREAGHFGTRDAVLVLRTGRTAMTSVSTALKDDLRRRLTSGDENSSAPVVLAFDHRALPPSSDAICLDSCEQFEKIFVNTRHSVYELIVLHGDIGDVLVRGGSKFPEFCRVRLVGSTAGGV